MAADLERRAREAFVDDNFELAVDLYTQALDVDPGNADLLADRAQANIKLRDFTEAVADANRVIQLDPSMVKAYLRKGIGCMKLEEYQTAKTALEAGAALAPGDLRFTRLIKECDERIAEENSDLPKRSMPNTVTGTVSSNLNMENEKDCPLPSNLSLQSVVIASNPKFRHDYYNSPTEVVLTIFAKGIPAENVSVDFGEQILSVAIDIPGEEKYQFQPRLFAKIVPAKCRYDVLSSKVEIHLWKAEPITWTSLEFSDKRAVPQKMSNIPDSASQSQRPSYPSSKSKIDWDKLEAQVKNEEKEEKLDGDAALSKFFREIYHDADEDTRRAMSKSFIESNGTVLSTNWKDVGSKKVEGSPPEGMELKKW
ncbi:Protein SGT [Ananas comosus]|uniref:Protein SGT1 homolog n=1 Tax=Ananas comosus TaxID=4615 RepID=A0A199VXZ4_ANACO|nr:Protein SGT [Ananas comosus]